MDILNLEVSKMAEIQNTTYLDRQEYSWILEALHDFNLNTHEYDHRIYSLMAKLQRDKSAIKFCHTCRKWWTQSWSDQEHNCPQEEE